MNPQSVPNAVLGYPGRPVNGGSNPRFYEFDDGVSRLVKWHPSSHGDKACYNELVASRLGQLIGAPMLRGIVVYVPDAIIPPDHKQFGAKGGYHFAVARVVGENFVPARHYTEIENSSELPAAAALLAWLAVGDQESHNQYLQREARDADGKVKETKRFLLVDMGQMFANFSWAMPNVEVPHTAYALPKHIADRLTLAQLSVALADVRGVKDEDICGCFEDRPQAWGIDGKDVEAGIKRVKAARDAIDQIIRSGNPNIQ